LMKRFKNLTLIKVKGHSGIEGNERADKLATSAILQKAYRVGGGVTPAVLPHHRTNGSVSGGS
ncbi:MAG: RNase H family protein, partial [Desulfatirhabdiaceae bacterium]